MSKPELLYISPVVPSTTGTGIAMRSGVMIEALSRDYRVTLLVIPIISTGSGNSVDSEIANRCGEVQTAPLPGGDPAFDRIQEIADPLMRIARRALYPKPELFRFSTPENIERVLAGVRNRRYDVVHVFRLYAAPFADPLMNEGPGKQADFWLDLDDIESGSHEQLTKIHERAGDSAAASLARSEALKYVHAEQNYLPRFDRVFVCSKADRARLKNRFEDVNVSVVPNAIRFPSWVTRKAADDPYTLLFVGAMGYFPNQDAVLFFCREILPRIRAGASVGVRLLIVGPAQPGFIRELSADRDVTVTGRVENVSSYYGKSNAAIVPLRAGSGTRIKILEAFAHGIPVISTSKGAEGLGVSTGDQLLIGDSPEQFAGACIQLMNQPGLRDQLCSAASKWVRAHHGMDAVLRSLREG